MRKTITCIVCPNGCLLSADVSEPGIDAPVTGAGCPCSIDSSVTGAELQRGTDNPVTEAESPRSINAPVPRAACPRSIHGPVTGAGCPRGEAYFIQEITDPRRTLASSVLVTDGELPLCSVRLTEPIPIARIPDVMKEIRKMKVEAPLESGTVLIRDVLGLGSNVIATKTIRRITAAQ